MKQKKLKGFTLIELIIVMALFSLIMYSVLQLIDPVSKYFVRSSNYENTTSCLDNMKRCIEGNLKYADRVRVYKGYNPYAGTYTKYTDGAGDANTTENMSYMPSGNITLQVDSFYSEFFEDRKFLNSSGIIYVLVFDNTQLATDDALEKMNRLSQYTENELNSGKLVLYQYEFDSENDRGYWLSGTPQVWYVNQKLYGNFDYRFDLGAFADASAESSSEGESSVPAESSEESSGGGAAVPVNFDPADCTITITAFEISRTGEQTLVRNSSYQRNTASFSMKNVLDSSVKYTTALFDYKTILNPDYTVGISDITEKYIQDSVAHPRYISLQEGDDGFDGFYFIFTVPENIYDNVDNSGEAVDAGYVSAVESAYSPT